MQSCEATEKVTPCSGLTPSAPIDQQSLEGGKPLTLNSAAVLETLLNLLIAGKGGSSCGL